MPNTQACRTEASCSGLSRENMGALLRFTMASAKLVFFSLERKSGAFRVTTRMLSESKESKEESPKGIQVGNSTFSPLFAAACTGCTVSGELQTENGRSCTRIQNNTLKDCSCCSNDVLVLQLSCFSRPTTKKTQTSTSIGLVASKRNKNKTKMTATRAQPVLKVRRFLLAFVSASR